MRRTLHDPVLWIAAASAAPVAWVAVALGLGLSVRSPAADLLVLALWSVSEEIVFRGAMQPWLAARLAPSRARGAAARRSWMGVTPANAVTSACFALAHLASHSIGAAAAVFPVSLLLGVVRDRAGRLWPPVALHVIFNGALYAASWWALRAP